MARRTAHQASFKAKVALAALKEDKTLSDLSQEFKLHPAQIAKWKTQAVQNISQIFEDKRKKKSNPEVDKHGRQREVYR